MYKRRSNAIVSLGFIGWMLLAPSAGRASKTDFVLLFDKRCPHCERCMPARSSRRQHAEATLTLLERQPTSFVVKARWQATYGMSEGPKGCLNDNRTPEGLYETYYVNRNHDSTYGYVSIILDYPNAEDQRDIKAQTERAAPDKCFCAERHVLRNKQANICGRPCDNAGGDIAIHGGRSGATQGCIRILDPGRDPKPGPTIHDIAIAQLAALVERLPDRRLPVISVPVVAASCYAAVGEKVADGCASALRTVIDSSPPPLRQQVKTLMAQAAGALQSSPSATPIAAPFASLLQAVPTPAASPPRMLRALPIESVWATSEAANCGADGQQPCSASELTSPQSQRSWCESVPGVGEGQWLRFTLQASHKISRIEIRNGFLENGEASPAWFSRGYVSAVEIIIDGRRSLCSHPQEDPVRLDCDLDDMAGRSVVLRIHRAVAGEQSEQTCISGVTILTPESKG